MKKSRAICLHSDVKDRETFQVKLLKQLMIVNKASEPHEERSIQIVNHY